MADPFESFTVLLGAPLLFIVKLQSACGGSGGLAQVFAGLFLLYIAKLNPVSDVERVNVPTFQ